MPFRFKYHDRLNEIFLLSYDSPTLVNGQLYCLLITLYFESLLNDNFAAIEAFSDKKKGRE
jgi:hypothetical protein